MEIIGAVLAGLVLFFLCWSLVIQRRQRRGMYRVAREGLRRQKQPRLSARLPPPACPFCGQEMRPGRIVNRGAGYPVVWEPSDAPTKSFYTRLSSPILAVAEGETEIIGLSHQATRGASICDTCGAVVTDPKRVETDIDRASQEPGT